jgi:uncharacterized protein (TIGR00369 family)
MNESLVMRWPRLPDEHFLHRAGFRLVEGGDTATVVELDLRGDNHNGAGSLQGGMLATLVDITAGHAVGRCVDVGSRYGTQDLAVHYLAAVSDGPVRATATVRRVGRTAIVVQLDVVDAGHDDRLCAIATVTYAVRPPPGP